MYKVFTMGLGVLERCVICLTVACLVIFSGCAAVVETQANPETAVTKGVETQESGIKTRVNEYWGYKIKKDFEKSYLYESPEYRQKITLSKYQQSFGPGVEWLSAKVEKVEVKKDQATVRVKIGYRWTMVPVGPKDGFTGTVTETWRMVDGTWYHVKKVIGITSNH